MSTSLPARAPTVRGTVIYAILGVFPVFLLLAQLVVLVPRAKKTFDEFGLQLPWLTKVVIAVSTWMANYWWLFVPLAMVLLALVMVGFIWLRHVLRYRATLLIAALLVPLVAANVIVGVAVLLPLVKLQEGLSK